MDLPIDCKEIAIADELVEKWCQALNTLLQVIDTPIALVRRTDSMHSEVICSGDCKQNSYQVDCKQNSYQVGDRRILAGSFCEAVAESGKKIVVTDIRKYKKQKIDPSVDIGIVSYLGLPLCWPNGNFFGTLCLLDVKVNKYEKNEENLLKTIKELIESHLALSYQKVVIENNTSVLASTLNSIENGIICHTRDRLIVVFNKAAERITGLKRNDVVGRDCRQVFPYGLCGANCSFCTDIIEFDGPKIYDTVIPMRGGKKKNLKMTITPLKDNDAKNGIVASFYERESFSLETGKDRQSFFGIIGRTPKMYQLYETIVDIAHSESPVIVLGSSGTGKELVAKAIHNNSARRTMAFVAVNCGAFSQGLIDSELFGHVKGAFTGAIKDKKGCFERAQNGTLFLDEVAELPKETQVKLLRVLQEKTFEPVGGEKTKTIDVRIISATNRDLHYMIEKGEFREDLYYRLAVFPIALPLLRERVDDIPLLVDYFIQELSKKLSLSHVPISSDALHVLKKYRWPGNIRQLQNAVHYALIKSKDSKILPEHLPPEVLDSVFLSSIKQVGRKQKLNRIDVLTMLKKVDGNKAKCARMLGVGRATLYNFLKKENIKA